MQQLRLFPREQRLTVVLIDDGEECAASVLRRLRRARRLEVYVARTAELHSGVRWPGGRDEQPAAVIMQLDGSADVERVREVVGLIGPVPLIAVASGRRDTALKALEAGAEEVVALDDATNVVLERAIMSAVHRRLADAHSRHRHTDPLTGLATRAVLERELPEMLARSGAISVAVLFCDLDKYKIVNDTHGHAVGDRILQEASVRLQRAVRSSDLVVRFGGDEFVVVIASALNVDALADEVAHRVVEAFAAPFDLGEHSFGISVSIGLATHRPGDSTESLVKRADDALYLAKQRGKGGVARYDEHLDQVAARRATSAEMLREGLRRDLLEVDVHPVVDANASQVVGHLYRPSWGSAPMALGREVPTLRAEAVARESGSGPALFRWTLERVVGDTGHRELSVLPSRRYVEMPRSVLVGSPGRAVELVARPHAVAPEHLVVVIDEEDLADGPALRAGLLELARHGARVAIGRFGAATGSLALMERHPFESVWIDRQMVDGLAGCAVRRAKFRAVAGVAEALGQQVMVDRPTRAEDARAAAELAAVLVVDGSLDLTRSSATGPTAPPPDARPRVGRTADRG